MARASVEYVYGINACFEVIISEKRKSNSLHVNEKSKRNPRIVKLVEVAEKYEIPVEWVSKERLNQLSNSRDNQGAVLKVKPYKYDDFDDVVDSPRILLFDNVEDPHNVGAVLRSAEIFGFSTVLMPQRGVPEVYPSVVKVSVGASEHLKIVREANSNSYMKRLQEDHGYIVVALDGKGKSTFEEVKKCDPDKILLVIGGEDKSVGQYILNKADFVVSIKQFGKINSLNASVAASISMYELGGTNVSE